MDRVVAYLGLGSNLGEREQNLAEAVRLLCGDRPGGEANPEIQLLRSSSVYETEPWGYTEQPRFLNCVVEVLTSLPPLRLLEAAKATERQMGREPGFRYGPRLIDVDILMYGDSVLDLPGLKVPHPEVHRRAFALVPLAELVPEAVHPVLNATVGELAERVEGREGVRPWGPPTGASGRVDNGS